MRRILTILIVLIFVQGCSDSDITAETISASSPFTCVDVNRSSYPGQLIIKTKRLLDQEYIGDSIIEKYYRIRVSNDINYATIFNQRVMNLCLSNSDEDLTDVMTKALNDTYQNLSKEPAWAVCSTYDETIGIEDLMGEVKNPTAIIVGSSSMYRSIKKVYNDDSYGEDYLNEKLESYCQEESNDVKNSMDSLAKIASEVLRDIEAEKDREREAIRKAKELEEISSYKSEIVAFTKVFSKSLAKEKPPSCEALKKQFTKRFQVSDLKHTSWEEAKKLVELTKKANEDLDIAFKKTMMDLAKLEGVASFRQEYMEESFDYDEFRRSLSDSLECKGKASVYYIDEVVNAVSDEFKKFQYELDKECPRGFKGFSCRGLMNNALMHARACEKPDPQEEVCFENYESYKVFTLNNHEIEKNRASIKSIMSEKNDSNKSYTTYIKFRSEQYASNCKSEKAGELSRQGMTWEDFGMNATDYVQKICLPDLESKRQEKLDNKITLLREKIEGLKADIAGLN